MIMAATTTTATMIMPHTSMLITDTVPRSLPLQHDHHHRPELLPSTQGPTPITPSMAIFLADLVIDLWHPSRPQPPSSSAPPTHVLSPHLSIRPFAKTPHTFSLWLHRVLITTRIPLSIVILAVALISRMRDALVTPPPPGSEFVVFVAAMMVAMKTPTGADNTYTNAGWHRMTKVPQCLLNAMEIEILRVLNFDVWVSDALYLRWLSRIESGMRSHPAANPIDIDLFLLSLTAQPMPGSYQPHRYTQHHHHHTANTKNSRRRPCVPSIVTSLRHNPYATPARRSSDRSSPISIASAPCCATTNVVTGSFAMPISPVSPIRK